MSDVTSNVGHRTERVNRRECFTDIAQGSNNNVGTEPVQRGPSVSSHDFGKTQTVQIEQKIISNDSVRTLTERRGP